MARGGNSMYKKQLYVGHNEAGNYDIPALAASGAHELVVSWDGLNKRRWRKLQEADIPMSISLNAFPRDKSCPMDPAAWPRLRKLIDKALDYTPVAIWLDHFRFGGHWETDKKKVAELHSSCAFCDQVDRPQELAKVAREVRRQMPPWVAMGYYAVPLLPSEHPEVIESLGQDHTQLAPYFEEVSPMLYHRMLGKPVEYISQYIDWLKQTTEAAILPILQLKDMPDSLPDTLHPKEIAAAYEQAKLSEPAGVAFFHWGHALEKKKTDTIQRLFTS